MWFLTVRGMELGFRQPSTTLVLGCDVRRTVVRPRTRRRTAIVVFLFGVFSSPLINFLSAGSLPLSGRARELGAIWSS